jgi:hypothetical protein
VLAALAAAVQDNIEVRARATHGGPLVGVSVRLQRRRSVRAPCALYNDQRPNNQGPNMA